MTGARTKDALVHLAALVASYFLLRLLPYADQWLFRATAIGFVFGLVPACGGAAFAFGRPAQARTAMGWVGLELGGLATMMAAVCELGATGVVGRVTSMPAVVYPSGVLEVLALGLSGFFTGMRWGWKALPLPAALAGAAYFLALRRTDDTLLFWSAPLAIAIYAMVMTGCLAAALVRGLDERR